MKENNSNELTPKKLLEFSITKHNVRLSKAMLIYIEDVFNNIENDFYKNLSILEEKDKEKILSLMEFDKQKIGRVRKRILDISGDSKRDILNELNNYDINFKKGKRND